MGESSLSCPCSSQTPSYQKEEDELLEAAGKEAGVLR